MGIVYYFLYYRTGLVGVVRRISDRKFILEKKNALIQNGIVYLIIVVALVGAIRFCYRKLKALKKDESCSTCDTCPLKDSCARKPVKKKRGSCCSS